MLQGTVLFSIVARSLPLPLLLILVFCVDELVQRTPALAQQTMSITVETENVVGNLPRLLLGQNTMFTGNGMWDTRINNVETGAASLIQPLLPANLRFPGGSLSDSYFWEAGLGYKTLTGADGQTREITLEEAPAWKSTSEGRFIDNTGSQFGDTLVFQQINGTTLLSVSGISTTHAVGAEVRPGPFKGQPDWFSNQQGIDEHMKLVESFGAQAIITVNYGSGRSRDGSLSTDASLSQKVKRATAWVAYLNGSITDSRIIGIDDEGYDWKTVDYWAKRRVSRGHPAPYSVKYWEIGNEVYGNWEVGFTSVRKYAQDCITFATSMKAIDPSIKIGAVGFMLPHGRGDADTADEWNASLLGTAGNYIDFLAVHLYYPAASLRDVSYTSTVWFQAVMAAAQQVRTDLQEIRNIISSKSSRASQIELAITEYGVWPADSTDARDYSNLARAIHDIDLLMTLFQLSSALNITVATDWNLHGNNQTSAIRYDFSTRNRLLRPQYHTFRLVGHHLAQQLLTTTVQSPVFSTTRITNVSAMSVPILAAVGASDTNGRLTLLVLNRSESNAISVPIRLKGYTAQINGTVRMISGPSWQANNEDNASTIQLTNTSLTEQISIVGTDTMFSYTFPARSATLIELQRDVTQAGSISPPTASPTTSPTSGPSPCRGPKRKRQCQ